MPIDLRSVTRAATCSASCGSVTLPVAKVVRVSVPVAVPQPVLRATALAPKKRGAKAKARNPLEPKVRELESKVARLEKELHKAHTILDVQEKVAGLLGFDLESGKNS